MRLDEFTALKEGDEIISMTGHSGIVAHASENRGVYSVGIKWGEEAPVFTFTSNQTIWMHWRLPELPAATEEQPASPQVPTE